MPLWPSYTTLMLNQSNAPASAYRGYMAGKPRFHPSAPDRNISPSGKNCFISAFVWKMKNRLLMYGIKRKGTWLKDLLEADVSAVLIVWMVLFLPPLPISLGGTLEARQLYVVRSGPVTLDGVAILSINHQLNQKWEETTPLTTLSHHLFTSHWFGKSHRSTASCPHAPTLCCWVCYYVKLCSGPRQGLQSHALSTVIYTFLIWWKIKACKTSFN